MATTYGIALSPTRPFRLRVEAQFYPGHNLLSINGSFTNEVHNVVLATMEALSALEPHFSNVRLARYNGYDLSVSLYSQTAETVGGESYGLPLAMAILSAVVSKPIASDVCFTGVIEPGGNILPVQNIAEKLRGARTLQFKKLVLPASQLDLTNTDIDQIPVDSLMAAMGCGLWA